jgi:hypothetical protein
MTTVTRDDLQLPNVYQAVTHFLCLELPFNPSLLAKTIQFFESIPRITYILQGKKRKSLACMCCWHSAYTAVIKWVGYTPGVVCSFLKVWTSFYSPGFCFVFIFSFSNKSWCLFSKRWDNPEEGWGLHRSYVRSSVQGRDSASWLLCVCQAQIYPLAENTLRARTGF